MNNNQNPMQPNSPTPGPVNQPTPQPAPMPEVAPQPAPAAAMPTDQPAPAAVQSASPAMPHQVDPSAPMQPGMSAPGQPTSMPMMQQQPGKGLAITALVLGIVALLSFWTIIGGILIGIAGTIFGIIATVKKQGAMGIVGLVLSVLAIVASIIFIFVALGVVEDSCRTDATFRADNLQTCLDLGL